MSVTLGRLRTFVVLAETRNFNTASQLVGRSQPAVTAQIKSLEEALRVPLFFRQTRNVQLTSEGKLLYSRIKQVLTELDEVLTNFQKFATLETGQVRVGATPTLASYILPEVISTFRKTYPGIRVHFTDEPTDLLEKMVKDKLLDFYFGPKPQTNSGLRFEVVTEDEYAVIVPESHRCAPSGKMPISALAGESWLFMHKGTVVRRETDSFFARHGLEIHPVEEVTNHFTLGGLVKAGCGVSLLPRSALPLIAHPGIAALEFGEGRLARVLGIATRADYTPSPAAKAFIEMMTPLVRNHGSLSGGEDFCRGDFRTSLGVRSAAGSATSKARKGVPRHRSRKRK